MYTLNEIIPMVSELGYQKTKKSFRDILILGFIAGALVSLAYFAYIKLYDSLGSGLGGLMGAFIFPIGLIVVLLLGGELISGNMTVVGTAYINKRISLKDLVVNWIQVTFANMLGALFVAYFFGILSGVLDPQIDLAVSLGLGKMNYSFSQLVISGVGCNWFVGLAVVMCIGAKDGFIKYANAWFPTAVFVIIGFQHCVANMFLVGIPVMLGYATWGQYAFNIASVFIGNAMGGMILVGLLYSIIVKGSVKE